MHLLFQQLQSIKQLLHSAVDGNITLTAGGSVFASSHVDQYVETNDGLGRARITRFVSNTSVEAIVEIPFFNTSAIASGSTFLESGYEDLGLVQKVIQEQLHSMKVDYILVVLNQDQIQSLVQELQGFLISILVRL